MPVRIAVSGGRVAMSQVRAAGLPSGVRTHTVTGEDGLPIGPVEEYLAFLRADQASPHTVQAYARGLAAWWDLLADQDLDWRDFPTGAFGSFLAYLRTGDLPSVRRVGPEPTWLAPASVTQRSAAVLAFYSWHAAAHDLTVPMQRLYTSWGRVRASRYQPMLTGVADHAQPRAPKPIYRGRRGNKARPPILTPAQVQLVLGACNPSADTPTARLVAARDRLFFTLLAETGLRLGEALGLRHVDLVTGAGDTPPGCASPRAPTTRTGAGSRTTRPARSTSATSSRRSTPPTCGSWSTPASTCSSPTSPSTGSLSTSPGTRCSRPCPRTPSTTRSPRSPPPTPASSQPSGPHTGCGTPTPRPCSWPAPHPMS
ncbi:site-specific integrase [Phycicoccus sp. KQZ13P-1]|nr:site-specific integrase [Phycicoccus mangrovi]